MNSDEKPILNWFLIDQEIPVREMVDLATANWMAALSSGADQNDRNDLAILAYQILEHAIRNTGVLDHRQQMRRTGMTRCLDHTRAQT
jgi:hypothetical protein